MQKKLPKKPKKQPKKAILKALTETDHNTIVGPISWKGGQNNPVKNACKTPLVGGQWKKGKKHKPNYSRRKSCPKHWKKNGNGRHRQWEKNMILLDKWDELLNQRKHKEVVSPWDWD